MPPGHQATQLKYLAPAIWTLHPQLNSILHFRLHPSLRWVVERGRVSAVGVRESEGGWGLSVFGLVIRLWLEQLQLL